MNKNNISVINNIEVNNEKIKRLLGKLIIKEKTNIKTKELNNVQMVKLIKKMIEEEVKCY